MGIRRVGGGWSGVVAVLSLAVLSGSTRAAGPGPEGTKAGESREDNGLKMRFAWCPAGEFWMVRPGRSPRNGGGGTNTDQVRVTLTKGFWLGRTEVTQGEWQSVTGTEPWKGKDFVKEGPTVAATYVSWEDAVAFCRKLTERERSAGRLGKDEEYRLPTEAEWESACRAGTTSAYSFGGDASRLGEYAWYDGNANGNEEKYAHAVGLKKANPWGLFDMHGNVWEWCGDWYEENPPGGRDPSGPPPGSDRVIRGGSWYGTAENCRSMDRFKDSPQGRSSNMGFRVARSSVR